jgi:hypothetical protein
MRSVLVAVLGAAVVTASPSNDARACVHIGGVSGPERISQKGQHALALFDGSTEHLVLKIEYEAGEPVSSLGLVVPVPAIPSSYGTAPGELFDELHQWLPLRVIRPRERSSGGGEDNGRGRAQPMVLLEPAQAGPYRIQPIQATGAAGVEALGAWMVDNDFQPIPPQALSYFAERGWTFLAVRVDAVEGTEHLETRGGLPPFRVSFETDRIVYPLKLEAQGVFPVRLYVVTRTPLPRDAFDGAIARGFSLAAAPGVAGHPSGTGGLTTDRHELTLSSARDQFASLLRELGGAWSEGPLYVRVLHNRRFGAGRAQPREWDEDLSIPPMPEGERLMGKPASVSGAAEPDPQPTEPALPPPETTATPPAAPPPDARGCGACTAAADARHAELGWILAVAWLVLRRRGRRRHGVWEESC